MKKILVAIIVAAMLMIPMSMLASANQDCSCGGCDMCSCTATVCDCGCIDCDLSAGVTTDPANTATDDDPVEVDPLPPWLRNIVDRIIFILIDLIKWRVDLDLFFPYFAFMPWTS